jgi:hypothetical protein
MHLNDQIALGQIREILGLRPSCSLASLVAAVRETKAAADLAGAALQTKARPTLGDATDPIRRPITRRIFRAPMDLNPTVHG